jgi:hypothetical protein
MVLSDSITFKPNSKTHVHFRVLKIGFDWSATMIGPKQSYYNHLSNLYCAIFHVYGCGGYNKVIRIVRKRRHRNPLFGHIGDEISKNRQKKGYTGLQGGMELSLAANLVLN